MRPDSAAVELSWPVCALFAAGRAAANSRAIGRQRRVGIVLCLFRRRPCGFRQCNARRCGSAKWTGGFCARRCLPTRVAGPKSAASIPPVPAVASRKDVAVRFLLPARASVALLAVALPAASLAVEVPPPLAAAIADASRPAADVSRDANRKPGGVYVVLDHVAAPGSPAVVTDTLHRIGPSVVRREVEAAVFVFEGESR